MPRNKESTVAEFCHESGAPGHYAGMPRPLRLFEVARVSLREHEELLHLYLV